MFSMWSRVQLRSRWCLSALGNLHLPVFQKFLRHCQTKSSSVLLIGNGPFSSFWGRSPRASSCYTNSTNAENPKYCTPLLQQLHWLPISEWIKYKTACMCYNAIFLSCYTFTILPALSTLHLTHACSKSNASTAKPMAFTLSHTLAPTSGTNFPKTSGTLLLSVPSKVNSRHFSSQNISVKPHCPSLLSVCTVCVCVCVCVCVRAYTHVHACVCACASFA